MTQAKELRKSLEEADVAQQKAKDAIKQANEDIALAKDDLEKVLDVCDVESVEISL